MQRLPADRERNSPSWSAGTRTAQSTKIRCRSEDFVRKNLDSHIILRIEFVQEQYMRTRFQKDEAAESTLESTGHLGARLNDYANFAVRSTSAPNYYRIPA